MNPPIKNCSTVASVEKSVMDSRVVSKPGLRVKMMNGFFLAGIFLR